MKSVLKEAEIKHNLRSEVLVEIYEAESRVVFMGRRRGINKDLRKIIQNALRIETKDEDQ